MKRVLDRVVCSALLAAGLQAGVAEAAVVPKKDATLADKQFMRPEVQVKEQFQPLSEIPSLAAGLQGELADLGVRADSGFFDSRTGRWSSLILSRPLIPGTGVGNNLAWPEGRVRDDNGIRDLAWSTFRAFLQRHEAQLRIDLSEITSSPRITVTDGGNLVQIHAPRVVNGIPVRDSSVNAVINHGNLILLGLQNWADVGRLPSASFAAAGARRVVAEHVSPLAVESVGQVKQELVPTVRDGIYDFRLAWVVPVTVAGDMGSWEAIVDASSGELLSFWDTNHYARRVIGGVYPVSNDQRPTDGVEQAGWPMPFATVTVGGSTVTATTGGTVGCGTGTIAWGPQMAGTFVRMNDNCGVGAFNETTAATDLDLGSGPAGTDCVVPAGHSPADTKASRSGFYELNRIKEQARALLPANTWLQGQLTSNMNINLTCNAFWSTAAGTVNFYRDNGSSCRNTGEIAAIFDHEWGHGMDANGTAIGVSQPGEGIADIHGFLRLQDPCIGRGFFKNQVCGGYGDPCDGTTATGCTGIRNVDYLQHACDRPHTVTWITSGFTAAQCNGTARPACPGGGGTPCGRATHCEGKVVGETAFDLARRDLTAPPFSLDANTAHEITTRLFTIGAGPVIAWYTCQVGGGCGATGGYLQILAVDDDNGNLNDGTPHMQAIRAAFERHEIHCATPAVANSGCAGGPTAAPTVTATAGAEQVSLSWNAVAGATRYHVFRAEGTAGCAFGKTKIASVTGTSYTDTGLQGGRQYSYVVIPMGASDACFGRASACAQATPTVGSCVAVSVAPQALSVDPTPGNGVLQPNEASVVVAPTWRNTGASPVALTGALSNLTGPAGTGVSYTINDAAADYGTIAQNTNQPCTNCYAVTVGQSGLRPTQHWDATALETVTPSGTTKNWTLHVGNSFTDVPAASGFYRFIETIFHRGITGGCGTNLYCPLNPTAREQMAVFVLASKEGSGYNPPACVVGSEIFDDVPASSPFCRWIEELSRRQVVAGCGGNNYCPQDAVTRAQMAIFVLRTLDPTLNPPACVAGSEMFNDVPASNGFCRWIEELARRQVVTGCGGGAYCPNDAVTREQMGVFLTATFSLTLYGL